MSGWYRLKVAIGGPLCPYVPKFERPEISQSQRGWIRHAPVVQRVGPSIAAVNAWLAACLGRGELSWDTRA
jgi:hypothetical protein